MSTFCKQNGRLCYVTKDGFYDMLCNTFYKTDLTDCIGYTLIPVNRTEKLSIYEHGGVNYIKLESSHFARSTSVGDNTILYNDQQTHLIKTTTVGRFIDEWMVINL